MIIVRAQNPVKFSAGSFFDINIETFDHVSLQTVCILLRKAVKGWLIRKNLSIILSWFLNFQIKQFSIALLNEMFIEVRVIE